MIRGRGDREKGMRNLEIGRETKRRSIVVEGEEE